MIEQVDEITEMTLLADKIDELIQGHELDTALNALLSVLTWKIVEGAEIAKMPTDKVIDNITKGLKEAAKQVIELELELERNRTHEIDEQTIQ